MMATRLDRWLGYALIALAPSITLQACEHFGSQAADQGTAEESGDECTSDDDCGLLPPVMSCCGECAPVPPFEAVPRSAIDARLLELETVCSERSIECVPPRCETAPPGCVAHAICVRGTCRVVEAGCDARIASLVTPD